MLKFLKKFIVSFLMISAFFTTYVNAKQPPLTGNIRLYIGQTSYVYAWTTCPSPYTASWIFASVSIVNTKAPCGVQNAIAQKGTKYGYVLLPGSVTVQTSKVAGTAPDGQANHVATDATSMSKSIQYF